MTHELNFKEICNLATRVMGLPKNSLASKTRKRNIQAVRSIAGYIGLTEENIPRHIVAKVLNRDRCITYHYVSHHKKNFKHCSVYRTSFDKIYQAYKDIDSSKKIFTDKHFMKSHLLQNGVVEKLESDVTLEVTSGQTTCKIKTSYFDFSNQLEKVKLALENYHFTIKII
tara:strand:- start:34 stop:543 length:510 start_codon:yes stop_codon:yes gene_type:complete